MPEKPSFGPFRPHISENGAKGSKNKNLINEQLDDIHASEEELYLEKQEKERILNVYEHLRAYRERWDYTQYETETVKEVKERLVKSLIKDEVEYDPDDENYSSNPSHSLTRFLKEIHSSLLEQKEACIEVIREQLARGLPERAKKVGELLGAKIDFKKYTKEIQQGYIKSLIPYGDHTISEDGVRKALQGIEDATGIQPDWTSAEAKKQIYDQINRCLEEGRIERAEIAHAVSGIDLTSSEILDKAITGAINYVKGHGGKAIKGLQSVEDLTATHVTSEEWRQASEADLRNVFNKWNYQGKDSDPEQSTDIEEIKQHLTSKEMRELAQNAINEFDERISMSAQSIERWIAALEKISGEKINSTDHKSRQNLLVHLAKQWLEIDNTQAERKAIERIKQMTGIDPWTETGLDKFTLLERVIPEIKNHLEEELYESREEDEPSAFAGSKLPLAELKDYLEEVFLKLGQNNKSREEVIANSLGGSALKYVRNQFVITGGEGAEKAEGDPILAAEIMKKRGIDFSKFHEVEPLSNWEQLKVSQEGFHFSISSLRKACNINDSDLYTAGKYYQNYVANVLKNEYGEQVALPGRNGITNWDRNILEKFEENGLEGAMGALNNKKMIPSDAEKMLEDLLSVHTWDRSNVDAAFNFIRTQKEADGHQFSDATLQDLCEIFASKISEWGNNYVEAYTLLKTGDWSFIPEKGKKIIYDSLQEILDRDFENTVRHSWEMSKFKEMYVSKQLRPTRKALLKIAMDIIGNTKFDDLIIFAGEIGEKLELQGSDLEEMVFSSPRQEALIYSRMMPATDREKTEAAFRSKTKTSAIIPELLAVQGPSKRAEFCPYVTDLEPLLSQREHSIHLLDPIEQKSFLEFIRRFGMTNLPRLAKTVMEIYKATDKKNTEEQAIKLQNGPYLTDARRLLGITDTNLKTEQYLTRLELYIGQMRERVLTDTPLDSGIESSALGMELFNALIPHTGSYQNTSDRPRLIAEVRAHEKELEVPKWLKLASVKVKIREESLGEENVSIEETLKRLQESKDKKYQDEQMQAFLKPWEDSEQKLELEPTGSSRAYWFAPLRENWEKQIKELGEKHGAVQNPKGKEAIMRQIDAAKALIIRLEGMLEQDKNSKTVATSEQLLRDLQMLFVGKDNKPQREALLSQAGPIARGLFLAMMAKHSSNHRLAIEQARQHTSSTGELGKEQVDAWVRWFKEEYLEHFANSAPDGGELVPKELQGLMHALWRTNGIADELRMADAKKKPKHPLMDGASAIELIDKKMAAVRNGAQLLEESEMRFYPVMGIGRVLAGDIANACYNKHRKDLAKVKYPKITAVLMSLPGEKEVSGSVLFIDTKNVAGERTLVIRALNPTEAVIKRKLDPTSVIEAVIEYGKQMMKNTVQPGEQPFKELRLCFDHSGGHSTNRVDVFQAEQKLIAKNQWGQGSNLENIPDTNFNGYMIWKGSETRIVHRQA